MVIQEAREEEKNFLMAEKNYTQRKSTNPNIHSSKRLIRIDKL